MATIKECPEDFVVKEIKKLRLKDRGEFAYFLLRKKGITTLDAVRRVARKLGVEEHRIGIGGLKDKDAITEQYISVQKPLRIRELKDDELSLTFLGYCDQPIKPGEIEGNYFEIKIRRLNKGKIQRLHDRIELVKRFGFENYFGEQRFGSAKFADMFIAKLLLEEKYEEALREYLTSMADKRRKKALLKSWGRWSEFMKLMPQNSSIEKGVVKSLMRGASYEEALRRLPKRVKLLFSFAYQSYLWNRYLSTFVRRYFKHCGVPFLKWSLAFTTEMSERVYQDIKGLEIPFLGTEHKPADTKIRIIIGEVLEEEGLNALRLDVNRVGIKLFTDGLRKAFVHPREMKVLDVGESSMRISFVLPPGSYATVLLRKLLCSSI